MCRQFPQCVCQQLVVSHIAGKGGFLADRFDFMPVGYRAVIHPTGAANQVTPIFTEPADEVFCRVVGNITDRFNSQFQPVFAAVLGPTPHSIVAVRGSRKADSVPGGTIVTALGGNSFLAVFFPTSVAILATSLLDATPTEQGSPSSSLTRF